MESSLCIISTPCVCPSFLFIFCFVRFCLFFFSGPHLQHMDIPRKGVESAQQLPAYTTAHSKARSFNPPSESRNQTLLLTDISRVLNPLSHNRNSVQGFFFFFLIGWIYLKKYYDIKTTWNLNFHSYSGKFDVIHNLKKKTFKIQNVQSAFKI